MRCWNCCLKRKGGGWVVKAHSMAVTDPLRLRRYVFRDDFLSRCRNFRRWLLSVRFRNGAVQIVFLGRVFSLALIRKAEGK